jgi:2'-5' RNA ligase
MPRLFIGTFLNDAEQARLASLPAENDHLEHNWQRKPRWIKPDQLHVTWLFLGNVDKSLIDKVTSALQKLVLERRMALPKDDEKTFTLEFNKPEVWPSARRPRIMVIASKPISSSANSLARSIRTGLIPFYTKETEQEQNLEFKPHVSLIRLDRRDENPNDKLVFNTVTPRVDPQTINKLGNYLPIKVPVEDVCLIESQVSGHYYKIIERVSLLA